MFWISIAALIHSYLLYPLILSILASGKHPNRVIYQAEEEDWPMVSVIMSLYNEELVIRQKLDTLLKLDYPFHHLHLFIGSDCSSDATNEIVSSYAQKHPNIHFFPFAERRGKPGVVNELVEQARKNEDSAVPHILVITDANVMPDKSAFRHLIKHFKNPEIVVVDANMVHTGMKTETISHSEDFYISSEVRLKHLESIVWGKMIGPFGGCYAIRAEAFTPVPANYLVDDFFITMKVLEKGGKAINELDAICFEAVSHEIKEEYRRKSRISAGNFQNMLTFKKLWWLPSTTLGFAFFSHKILRWLGPFFLLAIFLSSCVLSLYGIFLYQIAFLGLVVGIIIFPLLDLTLQRLGQHLQFFRNVRYFIMMNIALLEGFIKFIKGVKTNVWQPPKRNG